MRGSAKPAIFQSKPVGGLTMTVNEVQERVEKIASLKDDPEDAHCEMDGLYLDVLMAIAEGQNNAQELAQAAIAVEKLDLTLWYA